MADPLVFNYNSNWPELAPSIITQWHVTDDLSGVKYYSMGWDSPTGHYFSSPRFSGGNELDVSEEHQFFFRPTNWACGN